ncbi:MAG: 3-dehydroquinate synthase, partial [Acidobacteriota bacterium]
MPKRFDLPVAGPAGESSVLVGPGLLAEPPSDAVESLRGVTVFVVTSESLAPLLRTRLDPLLARARRVVDLALTPDGEAAKSIAVAAELWEEMLARGGKRDSVLVTLGGGSTGDLGGFVAGCFLRGIDYLQVPTTLLAQVDASVGGKTAINLEAGKNYVGRFHHPRYVLADTSTLQTLPARELR